MAAQKEQELEDENSLKELKEYEICITEFPIVILSGHQKSLRLSNKNKFVKIKE